ncbi:stress response small protein YobI, partial [Escherichia coli]
FLTEYVIFKYLLPI